MILCGQFVVVQVCPNLPETWEFIRMFGHPKYRGLVWANMVVFGLPICVGAWTQFMGANGRQNSRKNMGVHIRRVATFS